MSGRSDGGIPRRDLLSLVAALPLALAACRAKTPDAPSAFAPLPFASLLDCIPTPGLVYFVTGKPRALFQAHEVAGPLGKLFPEERIERFSAVTGGIDIRSVDEAVVAEYKDSELLMARTRLDPGKIERAFSSAATVIDARAIDHQSPSFVRLFGTTPRSRAQVLVAGRDAVFLETGKLGVLRAAEAFALGKLKRAQPALAKAPLSRAAELVGDGEVRAFAPGPFEGEWAHGLTGLLAASTGCAASARLDGEKVRATVALTGGFGDDAERARERLGAAIGTLSESALGKLLGLDRTLEATTTHGFPDAIVWRATYDAAILLEGLYAAVGANVDEMMKR